MASPRFELSIIVIVMSLFVTQFRTAAHAASGATVADMQTKAGQVRILVPNSGNTADDSFEKALDTQDAARKQVPAYLLDCRQAASSYLECIGPEHWMVPSQDQISGTK